MSRRTQKIFAMLAPGFGGTVRQKLLLNLSQALKNEGFSPKCMEWRKGPPSPGFVKEISLLQDAISHHRRTLRAPLVLVGRSFGGRICARLALVEPPAALVLLGYPIRPPGKARPEDEQTLLRLTCPTLLIQGEEDVLGPLNVLRPLVKQNPKLEMRTVPGVGHVLGRQEKLAITWTTQWLKQTLFQGGTP